MREIFLVNVKNTKIRRGEIGLHLIANPDNPVVRFRVWDQGRIDQMRSLDGEQLAGRKSLVDAPQLRQYLPRLFA